MVKLQIRSLGGFRLLGEQGQPLNLTAKKARALFAYLAMHLDQPLPRDRLASLLWDDVTDAQSRTNLRQALSTIRRALPDSAKQLLVTDNETVTLMSNGIETDVADFESLTATQDLASKEASLAIYQGEFLDGLITKARPFDDWVTGERYRLREQALQALERCLNEYCRSGSTNKAIQIATRLLMQDPLREDVHRTLMDLYAKIGRHGAAIKQYRTCQDVLRQELGLAPAPETQSLFNEISSNRNATRPKASIETKQAAQIDKGQSELEQAELGSGLTTLPSQELRPVTVLYIDLTDFLETGSTLDPEEFGALVTTVYSEIEACVSDFGGSVLSSAGHMVMTAFGITHTESYDTERAIRAAFALRERSADLNSSHVGPESFSGGIAVGQALVSIQTIDGSSQKALSGKVVNYASRLAAEAGPGEVWLSDAAFQPLVARLEGSEASPTFSNDYGEERAWSVTSILQSPKRDAVNEFVGRKLERDLLVSALENCQEGAQNRVVLIRGQPGIGKTHLTDEALSIAQSRGFRTNRSLLFDPGSDRRRDNVRDFICDLLTSDGVTPDNLQAWSEKILAADIISQSHKLFLSDLLAIPMSAEDTKIYASLSTSERNKGKNEVFRQILSSRTEAAPFMLVIEDIHWATPQILRQLASLCRLSSAHPVLLVMTTRLENDPIDAAWRSLAGNCALTTIDLAPFSEAESQALADQFSDLDEETKKSCIIKAEGNPLFLDQLLRGATSADVSLPQSIQTIILSRVDRLDPRDRNALHAAAIIGQQFDLDVVRHVADDPTYDPVALLSEVMVRGSASRFLFGHALIRDAILSTMLKSTKEKLHARAAEWYLPGEPERAAIHLASAGDPRAGETFITAARRAIDNYRLEDALELVTNGRPSIEDDGRINEYWLLTGHLLREVGRTGESIDALKTAIESASEPDSKAKQHIELATSLRVADRLDEALASLEQATACTDQNDMSALATIHFMKGNIHFPLGQLDDCLAMHAKSLSYAQKSNDPFLEAQALGGLGDAYYQRGEIRNSHEHYKRCTEICAKHGFHRLQSANMTGFGQLYLMETDAAFADANATIEMCRKVLNKRGEVVAISSLMQLSLYDHELDQAQRYAEQHIQISQEIGAHRFVKEGFHMRYAVLGAKGDRITAAKHLHKLYLDCDITDQSYFGPWILGTLAYFTPDAELREWALKEGQALLSQGCVSHCYFHFYQLAMETALETENWSEIGKYRDALRTYTAGAPLPWCEFYIDRAHALLQLRFDGPTPELKQQIMQLRDTAISHRMRWAVPKLDAALSAWKDDPKA